MSHEDGDHWEKEGLRVRGKRPDSGVNKPLYFTASSGPLTLSSHSRADKGSSSSDPLWRVGLEDPS